MWKLVLVLLAVTVLGGCAWMNETVPVPLYDDAGNPVLGADGLPVLADVPRGALIERTAIGAVQGASDALATTGPTGLAISATVNALLAGYLGIRKVQSRSAAKRKGRRSSDPAKV